MAVQESKISVFTKKEKENCLDQKIKNQSNTRRIIGVKTTTEWRIQKRKKFSKHTRAHVMIQYRSHAVF